jgi:hypothetical protein
MNHDPALPLMVVITVVVVIVLAWLAFLDIMTRHLTEAYQRVAYRFRGQVEPATWSRYPRLGFTYEGRTVFVDTFTTGARKNTGYYTRLRIVWPDRALRCELYPHGIFDRLNALFGMRDIEIGSPRFDGTYVISGSDAQGIRGLLTAGVQARVEALRRYRTPDLYVSWEGGMLTVRKQEVYRTFEDLQEFILLGLSLFDTAYATRSEGIQFVGELKQAAESVSDPFSLPLDHEVICRVCGEAITPDSVVFCQQCRTPHHGDCWKYYGACSVYGCGCKALARVPKKRGRQAL